MYTDLILQYANSNEFVRPQPPATNMDICQAEKTLGIAFPSELRSLLSEMDGEKYLFYSVKEIVEVNSSLRNAFEDYTDLSCFLMFAGNGCGDYYCYRIDNSKVQPFPIYIWEHESFQSKSVADNLSELIRLYYQDKI